MVFDPSTFTISDAPRLTSNSREKINQFVIKYETYETDCINRKLKPKSLNVCIDNWIIPSLPGLYKDEDGNILNLSAYDRFEKIPQLVSEEIMKALKASIISKGTEYIPNQNSMMR